MWWAAWMPSTKAAFRAATALRMRRLRDQRAGRAVRIPEVTQCGRWLLVRTLAPEKPWREALPALTLFGFSEKPTEEQLAELEQMFQERKERKAGSDKQSASGNQQ